MVVCVHRRLYNKFKIYSLTRINITFYCACCIIRYDTTCCTLEARRTHTTFGAALAKESFTTYCTSIYTKLIYISQYANNSIQRLARHDFFEISGPHASAHLVIRIHRKR